MFHFISYESIRSCVNVCTCPSCPFLILKVINKFAVSRPGRKHNKYIHITRWFGVRGLVGSSLMLCYKDRQNFVNIVNRTMFSFVCFKSKPATSLAVNLLLAIISYGQTVTKTEGRLDIYTHSLLLQKALFRYDDTHFISKGNQVLLN